MRWRFCVWAALALACDGEVTRGGNSQTDAGGHSSTPTTPGTSGRGEENASGVGASAPLPVNNGGNGTGGRMNTAGAPEINNSGGTQTGYVQPAEHGKGCNNPGELKLLAAGFSTSCGSGGCLPCNEWTCYCLAETWQCNFFAGCRASPGVSLCDAVVERAYECQCADATTCLDVTGAGGDGAGGAGGVGGAGL